MASAANLIQYTCQAGDGTANERVTMPPTTSPAVVHRPFTSKQPVAVIQGGKPAAGGTAPVSYNWINAEHQWVTWIDFNPDRIQPDPNAPSEPPTATDPTDYGYTGRPSSVVLVDGRVHTIVHDATTGDVQYRDQIETPGNFGFIQDIGGAMSAQPTLGNYRAGQFATYAVIGGALWYSPEGAGNLFVPIGQWRSLGGTGLTGVPATAPTAAGTAQIFVATTGGQIQTATLTTSTLGDWTSLGGTGLGSPNVLTLPGNRALVSARQSDGTIVYKLQQADGSFPAAWTPIAGVAAAGNPSAVIGSADGRIDIVIRGTDNLLYVAQETAAGSGQFGGWTQISDPSSDPNTVAASDPTAFAYDVPSGQSFGVVFQTASLDSPYGIYFRPGTVFTPAAGTVSRTTKVHSTYHGQRIGGPAKAKTRAAARR